MYVFETMTNKEPLLVVIACCLGKHWSISSIVIYDTFKFPFDTVTTSILINWPSMAILLQTNFLNLQTTFWCVPNLFDTNLLIAMGHIFKMSDSCPSLSCCVRIWYYWTRIGKAGRHVLAFRCEWDLLRMFACVFFQVYAAKIFCLTIIKAYNVGNPLLWNPLTNDLGFNPTHKVSY